MDLRIQKTQNALKKALLSLVLEKDFEKISVKDICEKADINRITFYDHYKDKYDLLNEIFIEVDTVALKEAAKLDKSNNPTKNHHDSLLNYLMSFVAALADRDSLIISMSKQVSGYIYFAFNTFLRSKIKELIIVHQQEKNLKYSIDQTTAFLCSGIISFVIEGVIGNKNNVKNEFYNAQELFLSIVNNNVLFK